MKIMKHTRKRMRGDFYGRTKDIIIWLGIFIVGSLIVSFLIAPDSFDSFKENINSVKEDLKGLLKGLSLVPSVSNLDIVENPSNYLGEEILLKDAYLCFNNGIVAYREDGSRKILLFSYQRDINEHYEYDLYGKVVKSNKEYYFNVSRAVQGRLMRDINLEHSMNIICK